MALADRLGISSSADLVRDEERISKKKEIELFEKGLLDQLKAGTFFLCNSSTSTSLKKFAILPVSFAPSTLPRAASVLLR